MQVLKETQKEILIPLPQEIARNDVLERIQLKLPPKIESYSHSVQSLIAAIKQDLNMMCQIFIHEPNDAITRSCIAETAVIFFKTVYKDMVEDYLVVCDETNNPPSVIDQGILSVDTYVKFDAAEHYVKLSIQIKPNMIDLTTQEHSNEY